jgi:hypothetical protein
MIQLFRGLLVAAFLGALMLAPARAATWDVRVQEKSPIAGQCVTGLAAGVLQTAACVASLTLSTSAANLFTLSGSGGALTLDLVAIGQNYVVAGPVSGGAGKPAGRALACADLPSGALCLLATLTASNSAALADTTSLLGGFADYELAIENLIPSTDAVDIYLQLQSGGGFQATGYVFAEHSVDTGASTSYGANAVNALALTRPGNYTAAAAPGVTGSVRIPNPAQTSGAKAIRWEIAHPSPTAYLDLVSGGGWWAGGNGAITGFQIFASAGNLASGVVRVYGRKP